MEKIKKFLIITSLIFLPIVNSPMLSCKNEIKTNEVKENNIAENKPKEKMQNTSENEGGSNAKNNNENSIEGKETLKTANLSRNSYETFNNLKLKTSFNFINKNQIEVKIFLENSGEKIELDSISLDIALDENVFKLTNKKSDIFKTRSKKLKSNDPEISLKEINFLMKKNKKIEINSNSKKEILKFTLDIKNKFNKNVSNVNVSLKFNDLVMQEFSEEIKVPQKEPVIDKISILGSDIDLKFDKNILNYDIYIPLDNKEIIFEVAKSLDGNNEVENVKFEINSNHSKIFKIGKYKIKVHKVREKVGKPENKKAVTSKPKNSKEKEVKKKIKIRKLKKLKKHKSKKENRIKKLKTKKVKKSKNQKKFKIRKNDLKSALKKISNVNNNQKSKLKSVALDIDEDDEYEDEEIDSEDSAIHENDNRIGENFYQKSKETEKSNKYDTIKLCVGSSIATLMLIFLISKLLKIIKSRKKQSLKNRSE